MVLSGRLEQESTASLCRRLAEESRTGCLHLSGGGPATEGEQEARVYYRDGRLASAIAPSGRARLGDRLVGGDHLSEAKLQQALALQATTPERRLGEVLIGLGFVDRQVIRTIVRDQMLDSLAAALGWRTGTWRFEEGETVTEDVPLGLGVQDALMEAARRLGQFEVIQAQLGSLDAVVDFAAGGTGSKLSLRPDEWAMLTHIDGFNSVADIAARSGYGQLETARIVYGLLCAGVVTPAPPAAPPPAPQPQATGAPAVPRAAPNSDYSGLRDELESLGDLASGAAATSTAPPPLGAPPPPVAGATPPPVAGAVPPPVAGAVPAPAPQPPSVPGAPLPARTGSLSAELSALLDEELDDDPAGPADPAGPRDTGGNGGPASPADRPTSPDGTDRTDRTDADADDGGFMRRFRRRS